ncbi:MAG TPA: hypothetical protein VGR06_24455 [Actinophytocola sp.]|uniref:hypothetical protein n=1 Tax=Actinophytocola sp. TaxID=1872138 RepID=UPI002E04BDE8|nr:hypothetical protein [Actinophytocola sp.]
MRYQLLDWWRDSYSIRANRIRRELLVSATVKIGAAAARAVTRDDRNRRADPADLEVWGSGRGVVVVPAGHRGLASSEYIAAAPTVAW